MNIENGSQGSHRGSALFLMQNVELGLGWVVFCLVIQHFG
jgi:hypothetical protein